MSKYSVEYFLNERLIKTMKLTYPNIFDILANMPESSTDIRVLNPPTQFYNLSSDNLENFAFITY